MGKLSLRHWRVMRSARLRGLAAAVVAVLAAACGDAGPPSHDALIVRPPAGDLTFVPSDGPPPGLDLRFVDRATPSYPAAWVALYGDPDAEDPLEGDIVHVIYYVGSETGYGWREGRTAGESWVVLPTDDDDQEIDDVVVGGRGVDEDDLRSLAGRVELLDTDVADTAGDSELRRAHLGKADLRSDRVLLAEGPIDLSEAWSTYTGVLRGGPALQWDSQDRQQSVRVSSITTDPATSLLIRSIVVDRDGTGLRGTDGVFGPPSSVPQENAPAFHMAVWEESGTLTVVQAAGLPQEALLAFIEQLRPSVEDDWPALVDEAEQAPPAVDSGTLLASGSFEGGRWRLSLAPYGQRPQIEQSIEAVDGRSFEQGGVGGCDGYSVGNTTWQTGALISGLAPPAAATVVLEQTGGSPIEVSTSPLPGGTVYWNVAVDGTIELTAVEVRDVAGVVLERIEADEPNTNGLVGGSGVCRPL